MLGWGSNVAPSSGEFETGDLRTSAIGLKFGGIPCGWLNRKQANVCTPAFFLLNAQ